jgi:hypothetical protein
MTLKPLPRLTDAELKREADAIVRYNEHRNPFFGKVSFGEFCRIPYMTPAEIADASPELQHAATFWSDL